MGRIGAIAVVGVWLAVCSAASAAFPGRNGLLAVQPLHGNGIVLVADGGAPRRICAKVSVCGHPVRPRFSPDGRSIVFAGPAIRLIGTDGSCQNCQFGVARNPAFLPGGALVSFVSGGLLVDAIDGLRAGSLLRNATDAVWSASGQLAVVDRYGNLVVGRGRLRVIGRGSSPSWSADGRRLAFVRRGWITVAGASGGSARRLALGRAPAFSPDGRWIAYIDPDHRVRVISSFGGRPRVVEGVSGSAVDWQPLPAHPPACVPPPGSKVLAQSDQAVLTDSAGAPLEDGFYPETATMGCLLSDGRERLLERSLFNSVDDATDFPKGAVRAPYAAVVSHEYDWHYGGESERVDVFDLRTGAGSGFGGESSSCEGYVLCVGIDQLLVGPGGTTAVHIDGEAESPTADQLQVKCASESLCLAFNGFGDVASTTSPGSGPWSPVQLPGSYGLPNGSSCASASLCVAVRGAMVYSSTGDPSSWTAVVVPSSPSLYAVSCPSTSLCVAAGDRGTVLVSTNPTGGASAWSAEKVDGDNLIAGVSCPSASECVATDGSGNVITTTNPTGGPSAWTVRKAALPIPALSSITCPSESLCLALGFGQMLVSTDPASGPWTKTGPQTISDVSCSSASLCVAVGQSNQVYVSTDPASGSWSAHTASGSAGDLRSISCPTATFCAAAGADDGNVLITHDPTAGPGGWTPVFADQIQCPLARSACANEQVVGSDRTGVHTLESITEFEPQSGHQLTGLTLAGNTVSWQDHGSPKSAQLAP